ncbi:MAG: aspartate aminotransferase family protein [Balneola sp.]|nr:aspartate aminotransferase family protein [Balneola sp.]MBO6652333.1 aspartate aminotransferase family protein [Balneola sp.]MBO6710124.1 aspartate aminotransferase family protein [Balneola sp.]MBO6798808.1 aspartate aminotransferase family protein [Balneola sp.]MBO6869922.1 aspartate aminotransferase family protein [Balneola sp.]
MNKLLFKKIIAQTSDTPMGLEISNAEGCYIFTVNGKKYLDFISGIAVSSLGHNHPRIIQALHEQIDKHLHVMVYGEFIQKPQIEFAQLLLEQLPSSLEQIYFVNSGTEAVEGALKLAKKFTERTKLVAFRNSYHGDTHGSLSVTGRDVYRDPYLPLLPNVSFDEFNSNSVLDLIDEETAAVILEPIQGEGGIIPANKEWLQAVRKKCKESGALLIFDEIQSGFGRTGKLFAFEHYEVIPDILCIAKAMGGGMPVGGFVSSSEIFQSFKYNPPLNHVTTFGGHPVSCAAAHANLKELLSGNYLNRAQEIENKIKSNLRGKGIIEVRGTGAMLGLELETKDLTEAVVNHCFEKGILLGWTLHSNTLVRLAPPLIITDEELNFVTDTILDGINNYF